MVILLLVNEAFLIPSLQAIVNLRELVTTAILVLFSALTCVSHSGGLFKGVKGKKPEQTCSSNAIVLRLICGITNKRGIKILGLKQYTKTDASILFLVIIRLL